VCAAVGDGDGECWGTGKGALTRRRRCTSGGAGLRPWELVGGGGALVVVW